MGTQGISLMANGSRHGCASFRHLFLWYCAGIVGATVGTTAVLEFVLLVWYLAAKRAAPIAKETSLSAQTMWLAFLIPLVALLAAILFFAWRMGRQVSQPVSELMRAVEKIRQHDLDFTISYRARNELGDLCSALDALRRELRESLEREWRKQEEMRTMVAALAHDLRTPVTILQGHVENLARAEAGEKRHQRLERYLPVLEDSSQRMARLLDDLLLVSALEQTSFVIHPQPTALEHELTRKVQAYTLQAAASSIAFVYEFQNLAAEASPVPLDLHRIEQVLDNLFENALRFTPEHGQIALTCIRDPRGITLILRDSGSGIAPEDMPHIWEKFYHGHGSPDGKPSKTTGLGLYICKLLVERHGGTITLENRPAGGCDACVWLPVGGA